MPDYSKRIVYLTEAQRQELFANNEITVDGVTYEYNENDIYVTDQEMIKIGTVTTLPAGSSASASITGSVEDMSLNLSIPMGETGDSGVYVGSTTPTDEDIVVWVDTSQTDNPYVEVITDTAPVILGEPNFRYVCGEVYTIDITPPSAGTIDVRFTSGSTPAVLTLPDTVTMPEWWVGVEANRTYDFCIIDGTYVGVMSWPV